MGLEKLINKLERLDLNRIERGIAESEKELIIRLNTKNQLFDKGIDSTGTLLSDIGGGYSPDTIRRAQKKNGNTFSYLGSSRSKSVGGSPILFDDGDFFNTWDVIISNDGFEPTADPIKEDTNLFTEWGDDITGLTDESLDEYIQKTLTKRQDGIRKSLL